MRSYFCNTARISTTPCFNLALHLSVVLGVCLQLLTIFLPGLRLLLGLELPGPAALVWVGVTIISSWGTVEIIVYLSNLMRGKKGLAKRILTTPPARS